MSSVEELKQLAEQRGLYGAAELIEHYDHAELLTPTTRPDPLLDTEPGDTLEDLLQQMIRRGHEPQLVSAALALLDKRPLERGLLAWDVMASSLVPEDDRLELLHAAARPLAAVLPPVATHASRQGMDLNQHPAEKLIDTFGGAGEAPVAQLLEAAKGHSLGALHALHQKKHELFTREPAVQAMIAFARALHLARLPTLASVYFDFLVRTVGRREAIADFAEALLDADAPERLPAGLLRKEDATSPDLADLAEYIMYRGHIAAQNSVEAYSLIELNRQEREKKQVPLSARFRLVQADLSTLFKDKIVPAAELDVIAAAHPLWRYAQRMRVVVTASWAEESDLLPLARIGTFVQAFGNELFAWYRPMIITPPNAAWKRGTGALMSRELMRLPHSAGLWKALVAAIGDEDNLQESADEVEDALEDQCELS